MNQVSEVSFGTDATKCNGYLQYANERLGNLDLIIENTSDFDLYFQAKVASTITASGFTNVGSAVTIKPRGVKTLSYNILAKKFGFFGSGVDSTGRARSVTANVSTVLRNKSDLRGAQVDIVNAGRRGWGYDAIFNDPVIGKFWGNPPDAPNGTTPASDGYGGTSGGGGS